MRGAHEHAEGLRGCIVGHSVKVLDAFIDHVGAQLVDVFVPSWRTRMLVVNLLLHIR